MKGKKKKKKKNNRGGESYIILYLNGISLVSHHIICSFLQLSHLSGLEKSASFQLKPNINLNSINSMLVYMITEMPPLMLRNFGFQSRSSWQRPRLQFPSYRFFFPNLNADLIELLVLDDQIPKQGPSLEH